MFKGAKSGKHGGWFPVDDKRIYLTGSSMGGCGSWLWGGHYPEHFAAIAPVLGGIGRCGPKEVKFIQSRAMALKGLFIEHKRFMIGFFNINKK